MRVKALPVLTTCTFSHANQVPRDLHARGDSHPPEIRASRQGVTPRPAHHFAAFPTDPTTSATPSLHRSLPPPTMSSRINIARPSSASSYSPGGDPHGLSNSRPAATGGYRAANPDDPLEKLRVFASKVEDMVEIYSQPLKPHLPTIGRFLIIVTFLEDAWRIMTQWNDQLWYLQRCEAVFCVLYAEY